MPEMSGHAGFKRCLQHTLYRPRDVLALLNDAFFLASKRQSNRPRMVRHDIESAARQISITRLDDLRKEYDAILPGLPVYTAAFNGKNAAVSAGEAHKLLAETLAQGSDQPRQQQEFDILNKPEDVLRGLYSVGFIGVRDSVSGSYVFCHDGRAPDREFVEPDGILIHPCYWMALNIEGSELSPYDAEEIYDEYDIEVSSETPKIRKSKISDILDSLDEIPSGSDGASGFEAWCESAIRICFAKGLRNVQLKPNQAARLRRDVVATNLADGGSWRRIREDYGTRQVTFEIKNVGELNSADYHQMLAYLSGDYGRLGFFVTRAGTTELQKGPEVGWVREMYEKHNVLMIKLTADFLQKQLKRLQNPQKHDSVDDSIHSILDSYARLYVSGQAKLSRSKQNVIERRTKRRQKQNRGNRPGKFRASG